ncbi:50S ribosomal protein L25 [Heliobacterium gestii]|uniref:Large ribosomal subunit protein bL25 n=1 Tax=Heliomicrobium gestii TaxID=2699 RepID=A0A845LH79_HELGE|nr:50S ribosomal protein L25 [Heliomicrobium gestii]MBM7866392.1 large subunit ribosomal protein L25 [Heliomicrobium gestii]MZP42823.1 50S ribosomal protein L25 [Heliomicrobium gestii]
MRSGELRAIRREKGSRGYINELRKRGLLPAVVYGKDKPDMLISVNAKELQGLLKAIGSASAILDLQVEGTDDRQKVMVRELQRDPVARTPNHIDFQLVDMNKPVHTEIPIHLVGTPAGVKAGGIIQHGLRAVAVEGLPDKLPPRFDLDIAHMELHDKMTVADIVAPEGIEIISERDQVILSIIVPRAVLEPAESAPELETNGPDKAANGNGKANGNGNGDNGGGDKGEA